MLGTELLTHRPAPVSDRTHAALIEAREGRIGKNRFRSQERAPPTDRRQDAIGPSATRSIEPDPGRRPRNVFHVVPRPATLGNRTTTSILLTPTPPAPHTCIGVFRWGNFQQQHKDGGLHSTPLTCAVPAARDANLLAPNTPGTTIVPSLGSPRTDEVHRGFALPHRTVNTVTPMSTGQDRPEGLSCLHRRHG